MPSRQLECVAGTDIPSVRAMPGNVRFQYAQAVRCYKLLNRKVSPSVSVRFHLKKRTLYRTVTVTVTVTVTT